MILGLANRANSEIYESTTCSEISEDTNGAIDVLASSVRTGGSIAGISRFIKKAKKKAVLSIHEEPS